MSRLLLLSNGHGEDLSGSLLAKALANRGHTVEALPLVGRGQPYRDAGIALIGGTQEFSTGGLGYTSLRGRLTEVIQGQVVYLLRRLMRLLRIGHRYDLVVVARRRLLLHAAGLDRDAAAAREHRLEAAPVDGPRVREREVLAEQRQVEEQRRARAEPLAPVRQPDPG